MAKCKFPLFSNFASGKLKSRLVFSQRSSGQQVRFQKSQSDFVSPAREAQRDIYQNAVFTWNSLSSSEKFVYILRAKFLFITGYNLFMSENLFVSTSGIYGVKIYASGLYGSQI